ncbi:MAG TPA: hypothetical protein VII93_04330 [Anaerolineales bacterium]|jgi:hypothetical protein
MAHTVIIHVSNEEPIVGELEQLPAANDTVITIHNPRRRDGKDVQNLSNDAITVIWPINQILFMEVMPGEGEERIIGFVRE